MTTDENVQLAEIRRDIKFILEKVACLPDMRDELTRHDERIKQLEQAQQGLVSRIWAGALALLGTIAGLVVSALQGHR